MSQFGVDDYREGALLRIREAQILDRSKQWVGVVYLAGRAAEAVLRGLLWARNRQQEAGHDLRELLARVRSLVTLTGAEDQKLSEAVHEVATVWRNDLRFTGEKRFRRHLRTSGRMYWIGHKRVKGDPIRANARSVLEACECIVAVGEPICRRYSGGSKAS